MAKLGEIKFEIWSISPCKNSNTGETNRNTSLIEELGHAVQSSGLLAQVEILRKI